MAQGTVKRAVGLEIDTGTARAVELAGKADKPRLLNLGKIALPEGAVKEGMILNTEQVGEALAQLWSDAGIKEKNVLLGVSNQGVLVRHINIPKVPPDKLKNVVTFQAQEHLPIPVESVVLDYLVLDEIEGSGEAAKELEILLVAARRDMLDKFLEALNIAGLEPYDIDVSSMTMIRLLPEQALGMTVTLVNVANGLNSILISAKGKPRLARLGLVKISDLAEELGCSLEDVFKGRAQHDDDSIIKNWIDALSGEIRSSLTYYQDQSGSAKVEGVLINGRGALFQGVAEQLEENLELPVRVFNPLKEFSPARRNLLKTDFEALEFAISTGLALRGLEG